MPGFVVCAHTCPHVHIKSDRRLSDRGYILWSEGGAYTNHKNSTTLHSQCASTSCNPRVRFKDVPETLWAQYANCVYDAYGTLNDEGEHTQLWAKQKRAIPKKYLTKSRGGILDVEPKPPSTPQTSSGPDLLAPIPHHPSPSTSSFYQPSTMRKEATGRLLVQQPRLIWTLRALQNEDILHQIFNHFGLWPGSRTAVQTRKDLLAAGKTCKVFLKPALNALWSVLPSLLPLLLLLPSAEVVDNEYFVDKLPLGIWERFEIHAPRVRALYIERPHVVISPHVYLRIRSMRHRDAPLLPGLKGIYIPHATCQAWRSHPDLSFALLLLASESSLNLIELNNDSATSDRQFFIPFLSLLSVNSPHLARLALCRIKDASACLGLVPRFKSLQSLELRLSGACLDFQTVQDLGTLDNLLDMTLKIPSITPTTKHNLTSAASTNYPTFVKLRKLHIIGTPSSISRVLGYMNILTNLTTLIIDEKTDDLNPEVDIESSWKSCFATISTFSAIEDIEINQLDIVFPDEAPFDGYCAISTSYLRPLYKLKNVTSFAINNSILLGSNDDLRLLACSFPKLKKFVTPCSDYSEERTLACLVHFSQANLDLREMKISISSDLSANLKAIDVLERPIKNHQHPLKKLHISSQFDSLDLSEMIQIAQFLDSIFPNLSILAAYGSSIAEVSSWTKIQKIRVALQATRIDACSSRKI